jgi:hypothetical protein
MSYPLSAIDVDEEEEGRLKANRIKTAEGLLAAAGNAKGRKLCAAKCGISEQRLLTLANRADRLRIKGMGKEYSALLEAAGVITTRELRYRNPANLARAMADANKRRKLVHFLPPVSLVSRWVEQAKKLPLKITYKPTA